MAKRTLPAPETVFAGGYEMFKRERVPLFEKWGWIAHHPQFLFDKDNYAKIMYDMFEEIYYAGVADEPEHPWYPYLMDFLDLKRRGKFDPESRLGQRLSEDIDNELKMRARKGDKAAAARLAERQAAAAPKTPARQTQRTHCCADTQEAQDQLPPAKAQLRRGIAVPEGTLW